MIDEILEAAETALDIECQCKAVSFVEEWVPRIVAHAEEQARTIAELRQLTVMLESQILEAEARIKEIE